MANSQHLVRPGAKITPEGYQNGTNMELKWNPKGNQKVIPKTRPPYFQDLDVCLTQNHYFWNGFLLSFQPLARIDEFTCVCLEQECKQEDKCSATIMVRPGHNPVPMETSIAADLKNLPKGRLQRKFPTQEFNAKHIQRKNPTQKHIQRKT